MRFEEEHYTLDGKNIILRCAEKEDADMLIDYLKTVCGETRFLLVNADEVKYTTEQEESFIESMNDAEGKMLMLAYVDGEYAGNCSFQVQGNSRRSKHRCDFGIALFQKYTGFGLGRLMMESTIKKAGAAGFEQMELTVFSNNDNAIRLYKSLGFVETGRLPNASRYDDGTYSDDIFMVKEL